MNQFATPEAVVMLLLESNEHPLHLGLLELFRPPPGAESNPGRAYYQAIREFRDFTPLFAGHPAGVRRGTSALRWTYDRNIDIDIDYHVRYATLPVPGGERELFALVSALHSGMLERDRPLWETHVIDGLSDGRFAVYRKMHHAVTDGVAGAKNVQATLSTDPNDREIRAGWTPRLKAQRASTGSQSSKTVRPKVGVGRSLGLMREALRERDLIPVLRAPRTIFNVAPGGPRRCAVHSWPSDRIKDVARAAGTTVNDAAVAMCAGALRSYLMERNGLPDAPLVGLVPVNLRAEDDKRGNVIGAAVCNLATDIEDPAKRLETIHASIRRNVQIIREMPQQLAIQMAGLICAPIGGGRGLAARIPPVFNLTITHVRGIPEQLYWGGARLEGMYPLAPTLRGQTLNIGLFSRAGELDFGIAASAAAIPDPESLIGHLETALKDLEIAVGLWN
jgi:WS/DGAT/MGAT family acyltransferase